MPDNFPPAFTGETVYHYTDAAGLIGMVQDRVLRATEASGMNDPREGDYGLDVLQRIGPSNEDHEDLRLHTPTVEAAMGDDTYIACASTRENDVSQWMRYTPWPAAGYCIGLDASVQLGVVRPDSPRVVEHSTRGGKFTIQFPETVSTTRWSPVLYGEESVASLLRDFPAWARSVREAVDGEDQESYDVESQQAEAEIITALVEMARLAKDGGFTSEREVRIVTSTLFGGGFAKYRASRYGVVRYVELGAGPITSGFVVREEGTGPAMPLPITSVMIGPSPYAERGKASVQRLLKDNGFNFEPTVSDSQIR